MAALTRLPQNFLYGNLNLDTSNSDTTLSSSAFASLPGGTYSTSVVLPLALINTSLSTYEIVWVTGHVAGASQVTVVRGKEGTTSQPWPANSQVICTPTATRDALGAVNSTALPPDGHTGWRALELDTGVTVEQTYAAGYQASVGVAMATEIGAGTGGAVPPAGSVMIKREGTYTGTTDSNGQIAVPFTTPFPNGYHSATLTPAGSQLGPHSVASGSKTGLVVQVWKNTSFDSSVHAASGIVVPLNYSATGY